MKKQKVIQGLYKDTEQSPWWAYKDYQQKDIDLIEEWLKKNQKDIILTQDLFENMQNLSRSIGCHVHPAFREMPDYLKDKEGDKNDPVDIEKSPEQNQQDNNKYILMSNYKVDYLTIKFMNICWSNSPNYTVLRFFNNNLSEIVLHQVINLVTNPANRIFKFFFEWNPIQNPQLNESFFQKIGQTHTLEFLVLRANKIDDQTFIQMINAMQANPGNNIKYLELYDNNIGQDGLNRLGQYMDSYFKFEYIGLAKNNINSSADIFQLMKRIGKEQMTPQQIEDHHKKEKEREELIAKYNKIKKKYTEDMLPKLDTIVQLLDGSPAILKNQQLVMLNLSMNNLNDNDLEYLIKFQFMLPEEFQIVLLQNNFDAKSKDKIRKKLQKNVQI